jgi:hypothetical protein
LGALSADNKNPEQTIELCVDIDLTGHRNIVIGDHRKLIASDGCKRGPRSAGPTVRVKDKKPRNRDALFVIRGDDVCISGFRLEGPTDFIGTGQRKEKGIRISPSYADGDETPLPPIRSVEISNMEMCYWSGVGVQVEDNVPKGKYDARGRLFNTNPAAVRISGNYIHHNRHGAGEGYGVNSTAGAYVLIEQNVFEENRHAIAGGSRKDETGDYSGYTARDNLILPGGGVHILEPSAGNSGWGGLIGGVVGGAVGGLIGGVPGAAIGAAVGTAIGAGAVAGGLIGWQTHQIDMHGTKSTTLGGEYCCGIAGETIMIERNTILYDGSRTYWWMKPGTGPAIKIRGNPIDKAVADGNVFRHKNRGDAIAQNGDGGYGDNITNPIQVLDNNVFDCGDLEKQVASGDFVGDGQQDEFMTTGVTWWAKSPTTGQWRYLNTMREQLPHLELADVDQDAICDVAPRTRFGAVPEKYSKSGITAWLPHVIHP